MKNYYKRTSRFILLALLVLAFCGNLIDSTSQAAKLTSAADAATTEGTVVAWGSNNYGQSNIPAVALSGVTAMAAGGFHSLALKSDGSVIGWGRNSERQLNIPAGLSDVTAIAAGGFHSLALKSDGTVVGWGTNHNGQFNVLAGLSGVTAIAAGLEHSLALRSDGTVVGCGYNDYGQITIPDGLSGVVAIAAGAFHSLALKSDGTVVAWGINVYGQASVPPGLTDVAAISAGGEFSMALKSDGSVVAWGINENGQIAVPAGLSGVTAIAGGGAHSLALKSDGTVVAWGVSDYGSVTPPAGLNGVMAIAAGGGGHSLALIPTPPNSAPVAVSKNITVSAGSDCTASITASEVNDGSYDPDGDAITLSLDSTGPFGLGNHNVTLTVTDNNGASSSAAAVVAVVNSPPVLGDYSSVTVIAGGGATATPASPPSDSNTISDVTVTAPGFTGTLAVDPTTGVVSIGAAGPAGGFTVSVRATDSCGEQTIKTFILNVTANTCGVAVNPATLPQPYIGVSYSSALSVTANGNYTFSVSEGQLPPGLQLTTARGVTSIAGSPTTPGTYNFTIRAMKNGSCNAVRSYTLTIPATVAPILECVQRNQNGSYTARFGYDNSTGAPVTIPAGANNYFTPGNQNRGQTTVFQSGRVANAFSVTFSAKGNNLGSWFLRGPDGMLRSVNVLKTSIGCP